MAEYKSNLVRDGKGGLIRFPPFISQADMDQIAAQFVPEDGDVFVTTYPRSGTTWTEQIVHLLVNGGEQGDQRITDAVPWLETLPHRPNGMLAFLRTLPERRLFTSHLPYSLMPDLGGTTAKVVYVARNPKDVAVSMYYHEQSKAGYEGTWEEYFRLFLAGEAGPGSYFDHVLPWWEAAQRDENILFLKYENMKLDHAGHVRRIAAFLDIPAGDELVERVVAGSTFRAMTTNEHTNFDWVPQAEDKPKHFRKGDIGDWRNHFSPEQSRQLDALYMQKLQGSGLQFDFGEGVVLP